jgi:hypothetical protein
MSDTNLSEIIVMVLAGVLTLACLWGPIKHFFKEIMIDEDQYIGR